MPISPRTLRPRQTGFDPRSIAGLSLWLDAADASTITVGTGVSQWRDKSTNGSLWTQGTGNNQPATGAQTLAGRNVLVFDGSNDTLAATAPFAVTTTPFSLFVVQRVISTTNFGHTITAADGSGFALRQNATTGQAQSQANAGQTLATHGSSGVGVTQIVEMLFPAGGPNAWAINGTTVSVTDTTTAPTLTGNWVLGGRSSSLYANVWIAEVIAYNALLSAAQCLAARRGLAGKWGVTVA